MNPDIGKGTQFKPGQSGNPNGRPKGSKSWSTVIRDLLEDENFEIKFTNGDLRKYPAKVIAEVMIKKAASGDVQAAKWLKETGYGSQIDVTVSTQEKVVTDLLTLDEGHDEWADKLLEERNQRNASQTQPEPLHAATDAPQQGVADEPPVQDKE